MRVQGSGKASKKPDLAALFGATEAKTFLGLEACHDLDTIDASSAFVGAPCATPYSAVGAYAKNTTWTRIRELALGLKPTACDHTEAAIGAAKLAMSGAGRT